jgi:hypothetical protein
MSDDDPDSECCPICENKECERHLLARFDTGWGEGELGVGLIDGALYSVKEIETLLNRTRLAWVQSVRSTGKPKAPPWIMKEEGLQDYFEALGGIDVARYDSDEDAVGDLKVETTDETWHAREDFLDWALFRCGWPGEKTEEYFEGGFPGSATTYLSWWASKPKEIAKKLRVKLRKILLEADNSGYQSQEDEAHQGTP